MSDQRTVQSATPRYLTFEEYNERIRNLKNSGDVMDFAKALIAPALQEMLDAELTQHLVTGDGVQAAALVGGFLVVQSSVLRRGIGDKRGGGQLAGKMGIPNKVVT